MYVAVKILTYIVPLRRGTSAVRRDVGCNFAYKFMGINTMNELLDAEKILFPKGEAYDKIKWMAWQTLKSFILAQQRTNNGSTSTSEICPHLSMIPIYDEKLPDEIFYIHVCRTSGKLPPC